MYVQVTLKNNDMSLEREPVLNLDERLDNRIILLLLFNNMYS